MRREGESESGSEVQLACGDVALLALLPLPHREEEQTTPKDQIRRYADVETHLRSRLASFHSRSMSLRIWSVSMSCLRSGECVRTKANMSERRL